MKEKCRNRLNAYYPMRLALCNVKPQFRNFVHTKKVSFVSRFFLYLRSLLLSSVASQLFFEIAFLNDFGSLKKRVEKHCTRPTRLTSPIY